MTNVAVVGAQWGDEGKGKVVDILAANFDFVVRYQGGHNAGHSVVFDGKRYALHVLPSGVFHEGAQNVIGNGVVVDPFALLKEIQGMRAKGIELTPENLVISDRAHLILPYHGILDRHRESANSERQIGTTGRGIGPAYEWKFGRRGLRFCDAQNPEMFKARIADEYRDIQKHFPELGEFEKWDLATTQQKSLEAVTELMPFVTDSVYLLADARQNRKRILFEGAQATLLDIDFGTYPYVTSSNSCALGITAGAGVPPGTIDQTIGIFKAYTTRVGRGPFVSELHDETGEAIREAGHEFGTTTGRPRRCGWLDLVSLRYVHLLNNFTTLAMMKLDVLDQLDEIKVCEAYQIDGKITDRFPASLEVLQRATPVYRTFPGWKEPLSSYRNLDNIPAEAKAYLKYIEDKLECPIGLVSVGPDRQQTIFHRGEFFN